MSSKEDMARQEIVEYGRSLFNRGLTGGSSGNMSVRLENGTFLMTPTNSSFGNLDPQEISCLDSDGNLLSGKPPSKEFFLHRAFYSRRSGDHAVVHTHSTYCVAVSCLADVDPENVLPPITPYSIMRFGRVALVPYYRPGHPELGREIEKRAEGYGAVFLANHGPVVSALDLPSAVNALEELEETAKLAFLLNGKEFNLLSPEQIDELSK